ncbi:hypothetical protein TcWFU_009746 [Taenia crassiceps]|uniref:Protein kinase domain-containing protein n=1 Tax=Taenia crassiceps TaxID=6207 RepID=A0ABR4QTV1_9CEST
MAVTSDLPPTQEVGDISSLDGNSQAISQIWGGLFPLKRKIPPLGVLYSRQGGKLTFSSHRSRFGNRELTEVEILKKLNYPCIVQIHDVIETEETLFIVLELTSMIMA